jgi:hypothetical protein
MTVVGIYLLGWSPLLVWLVITLILYKMETPNQ